MSLHLTSCEYAPPEVHLKELHADERGMEVTFAGSAVRVFAEGIVDQFHKDGGINYVEWNVHRADEGWFVLTMRRREGKSPGQVAHERMEEIERLKRLLGDAA
jgi:hypothetical protein